MAENGSSDSLDGDNFDGAMRQAYRQGRELYQLEADMHRTSRLLNQKRNRLAAIETEMRDTGIELVTEGISTEQRVVLLDELRKLEQERSATKAAIPSLEADLVRQEEALARISARQEY